MKFCYHQSLTTKNTDLKADLLHDTPFGKLLLAVTPSAYLNEGELLAALHIMQEKDKVKITYTALMQNLF